MELISLSNFITYQNWMLENDSIDEKRFIFLIKSYINFLKLSLYPNNFIEVHGQNTPLFKDFILKSEINRLDNTVKAITDKHGLIIFYVYATGEWKLSKGFKTIEDLVGKGIRLTDEGVSQIFKQDS